MFDIRFLGASHDTNDLLRKGEICLGDFRETFECSVEFWEQLQYEHQWLEGIKRFVEDGADSCLITSLTDPATANFVFWWLLYHDGDDCVFQNHVLLLEELEGVLDVADPYQFIPPRETVSEEGEPTSEWRVPGSALRRWKPAT